MTITKGSRAAHERSLKAAKTRRRNKNTRERSDNMQQQPFSASYPHLEGAHVEITYGEYAGHFGIVKSTIPQVYKPTKDNPWKLRVRLDGYFKSAPASLVIVPQTYLRRSAQQIATDEKNRKSRENFRANYKPSKKPFSEYVAEERARREKEDNNHADHQRLSRRP